VPPVCHRHLPGTQTPSWGYAWFGPLYPRAPPVLGSGLSPCHASVAYPAGAGLPGLLRGGVLGRHHLTSRPAGTALRPCMRASGAAAHTAAASDRAAALVSLRAAPRQAHPRRAGAQSTETTARSDDCADGCPDRGLLREERRLSMHTGGLEKARPSR
jgi:hypothetical protein